MLPNNGIIKSWRKYLVCTIWWPAAASIAQVHTAALHDGREVKWLAPTFVIKFCKTLRFFRQHTRKSPWSCSCLTSLIQDYRQIILNELDLSIEALVVCAITLLAQPWCTCLNGYQRCHGGWTYYWCAYFATFDRLGMDRAQLAEKGFSLRKYSAITFSMLTCIPVCRNN